MLKGLKSCFPLLGVALQFLAPRKWPIGHPRSRGNDPPRVKVCLALLDTFKSLRVWASESASYLRTSARAAPRPSIDCGSVQANPSFSNVRANRPGIVTLIGGEQIGHPLPTVMCRPLKKFPNIVLGVSVGNGERSPVALPSAGHTSPHRGGLRLGRNRARCQNRQTYLPPPLRPGRRSEPCLVLPRRAARSSRTGLVRRTGRAVPACRSRRSSAMPSRWTRPSPRRAPSARRDTPAQAAPDQ
jgi:hypothetical protein